LLAASQLAFANDSPWLSFVSFSAVFANETYDWIDCCLLEKAVCVCCSALPDSGSGVAWRGEGVVDVAMVFVV
jgi:hypothetical protein